MKRRVKITIIIVVICILFILSITVSFKLGYTLGYASEKRKQIETQIGQVENLFETRGYEIDIIGANTNGREHAVPFLYEWNWKSFEIGSEVVVLYYYDEMDEIVGYLTELDDVRRENCRISEHFVFYYDGNNEGIIDVIDEYCKQSYY